MISTLQVCKALKEEGESLTFINGLSQKNNTFYKIKVPHVYVAQFKIVFTHQNSRAVALHAGAMVVKCDDVDGVNLAAVQVVPRAAGGV